MLHLVVVCLSIVVSLIIFFILFYAYRLPDDYTISRVIVIEKTPNEIFPYINNSKLMHEWAPWPEVDPQLVMTFTGSESGVGASSSWDSAGKMGTGSATIIESIENQKVSTKLEYTKPFKMTQIAEITLISSGNSSIVRWSVTGKNGFMQKVVCIVMDMDKMVGGNFTTGLLKLKAQLEISK